MSIKINEQQEKAINHSGSPLMLIAGPGSGKTFVIVQRVIQLVNSGIPQDEILCLTFTEKAAGEMKQRLEKEGIIDAKTSTFHAFAMEVLGDNYIESGLGKSTKILKKSSQMVWCIKNTDKFDFDPEYIKLGNNQVRVYSAILEVIRNFKEEMISPEELQKYIDNRLAELVKISTDDPVELEKISEENRYLHRHHEFNKVYKEYEKYRIEKEVIDFDDMVGKVVELFKTNPAVLSEYQKKFQHVLVDEFQDNNFAQFEVVKHLTKDGNITVVGDDDQCIMRFQGAYFGIFDDFEKTFPDYTKLELGRNYRSTKNIVNLSSNLLSSVEDRLKKSLFSDEEEGEKVKLIRSTTDSAEVEYVVNSVREMIGKPIKHRDGTKSKISYKDIAILTRRRTEGEKFTKALKSFGIPTSFIGESNIFSTPVILDMLSFLKIANLPTTAGIDLYRLMKNHGISQQNIAVLTNTAHEKARHLFQGQEDFVLETMKRHSEFEMSQKEEISELVEQIEKVIKLSTKSTIPELVYQIMMSISGIYKRSIQSDRVQDKKNLLILNKFFDISQEFQDLYPEEPLEAFLEHLSILGRFDIEMEEGQELEDAVRVMTMHKSKGKQFPIVFVTDLAERKFPTKYQERIFHVPIDLMKGVERTVNSEKFHTDEERRLFYVAMTRAENQLFLFYPKRYSGNVNEKEPSQFLLELEYEKNPYINLIDVKESGKFYMTSEDLVERIKLNLQNEAANSINQMHLKSAIHRIIELSRIKHFEKYGSYDDFKPESILKVDVNDVNLTLELEGKRQPLINKELLTLSPSSIKAYNDCPLKFKFQKIMRVPRPAGKATDLGTVIHAVVEELAKQKAKGIKLTKKKALKKLEELWIFRSYQSKTDEDAAMERAKIMIDAYLDWEEESENKLIDTEISFKVKIGGVIFTGKIDRLEENPKGKLEIVDFKSGSSVISKNKAKVDPQLNIYAKAVKEMKGEFPVKASLFYLEKKMVEYEVSAESVNAALAPIEEMTKDILAEKFEPTPSTGACMFCPYQSICDAKILDD